MLNNLLIQQYARCKICDLRTLPETVLFKTDENITGKGNSLVAVVFFTEKHAHSLNKLQKIMHTCGRTSDNNTAKSILKKRQNV